MCEAEDRLRKLYKWLDKNHNDVYVELLQKDAKEALAKIK